MNSKTTSLHTITSSAQAGGFMLIDPHQRRPRWLLDAAPGTAGS